MRIIGGFAAGVVMLAMLSAMVIAGQDNNVPPVQQQVEQRKSLVDKTTPSNQPDPRKTGLSKRNKAMIEQAEQRKLRQIEIDKEQDTDP